MFYRGWDYWIHKISFGTFTGKVEARKIPTSFIVLDENKTSVTEKNIINKIVLLYFWITRCGICFDKFPYIQTAFDKYKNDSLIMILAVNKPLEGDKPDQAYRTIKEEGYSFPVFTTKDEDLLENFDVKYYPTTFVIDRNGMIVFKGDIAGAVKMIGELKSNSR
jgi:peroxiredoxin